jgi:hypothetical protein
MCILKPVLIYRMSSWIDYVSNLIAMIHMLYVAKIDNSTLNNNEGNHVAWLVVFHDGWDSVIKKQFFGVLVYFIDPVCWVCYKLALGLAVPTGHGAEACAEAAWVILRRYGIRQEDIDRSMNDTTNASVATGRLLAGGMAHVACMLQTSWPTMHRESVSALRIEL